MLFMQLLRTRPARLWPSLFGLPLLAGMMLCTLSGCSSGSAASSTGSTGGGTGGTTPPVPMLAAGIQPLTPVNSAAVTGYFVDPLPVHLAAAGGSYLPSIVGTTHGVLDCAAFAVGCYSNSALTITTGDSLNGQLPAGAKLVGYQNNNVYQDNAGVWQMATTATVNNPAVNPQGLAWNVILHASPVAGSAVSPGGRTAQLDRRYFAVGVAFSAQSGQLRRQIHRG